MSSKIKLLGGHGKPFENISFWDSLLAALGAQQRHHPKHFSSNVDNEGLIGRAREDHCFGFRRANIFRRYQAELGLRLASALGWRGRGRPSRTAPLGHQKNRA